MVWNRSRTDRELADPGNAALGRVEVRRRNTPDQWVISQKRTHPALVSEADFIAVQDLRKAKHEYQLKGLLCCVLCERRFEGDWTNQVAGYRCRHGHTSAMDPCVPRPRNTYLREDRVLAASTARPFPPSPEEVIDHLRAHALVLRYDPRTRTLETGSEQPVRITI